MNDLQKSYVRGLYKEAKVKETLTNLFEAAKQYYKDNAPMIKRTGITSGSALAGAGISAGIDKLRGKKVSLLRMLLSGATAAGVADRTHAYIANKEQGMNTKDALLDILGLTIDPDTQKITTKHSYNNKHMNALADAINDKSQPGDAYDKQQNPNSLTGAEQIG